MKLTPLLLLPLFCLSACSDLNSKDKDEPASKPAANTDVPPPPPELPTDGIDFSDPETSGSLLTDDKKKTVAGPLPTAKPIEGDNIINVSPPPLPTPSLPEE